MNIKKIIRTEFSLNKRDVLPQIKINTDGIIKRDYIQKKYKKTTKKIFLSAFSTAASLALFIGSIYKYYESSKDLYILADKSNINYKIYFSFFATTLLVCLFFLIKHLIEMKKIRKNIKK